VVVELSKIVTAHPTGTANLYLRYKYVPGYQDGEFICPIEKAPLVFPEKNVGIGTTSPSQKFEVVGYGSSEQLVSLRGPKDLSLALRSKNSAQVYYELADGNNGTGNSWKIGTNKDGKLHFGYGAVGSFNSNEKMTILTDGNVGIGTTNPSEKLHVDGGNAIFLGGNIGIGTASPSGKLHVQDGNAIFRGGSVGIGTSTPTGKLHVVGTGTTFSSTNSVLKNQVTINDGNVGIGTDNPHTKLHIVASGDWPMIIENAVEADSENDGDADIHYLCRTGDNIKTWQAGANSNGWYVYDTDYRLLVHNGGNVGIGTTDPKGKLDVHGGKIRINGGPAMEVKEYKASETAYTGISTEYKTSEWEAAIIGFQVTHGLLSSWETGVYPVNEDGKWSIKWYPINFSDPATIRVLFIRKEFF
jgi:hypothetical protein